ncbi:hypothetical protein PGTUg99_006828 [Puccinia graminis f. sp. tritici]|uniref:Uncharacterized protein n=1 Tax=Puccinia graminis f. sp. tritici TaxID=56615 RepID=A0A5B0P843_PUCGR|nr:hypothetical protein PGTUg99_006828 [Puccinia graminis f. sp. tritici]
MCREPFRLANCSNSVFVKGPFFQFLQFAFLQGFAQGLMNLLAHDFSGIGYLQGSEGMVPNLKVLGGIFLLTRLGTDQIYQFLSSRFFQGLVL